MNPSPVNVKQLALLFLGFSEDATPTEEEVKKAYTRMAKFIHPDQGGDTVVFRGLTKAKEFLLQPEVNVRMTSNPSPFDNFSNFWHEMEKERERQREREKWQTSPQPPPPPKPPPPPSPDGNGRGYGYRSKRDEDIPW